MERSYEMLKRCVLSLAANISKEVTLVTESGREFHNRGLPRVTDLSPNFTVLDGGGTNSKDRVLDLK
jgi:hypothetical protein